MRVRSAVFVKSGVRPEHYPPADLPEVAFAGRSNVGKSSLINALIGRKKLVKVSGTPGRTQLLSWFDVNDAIRLCDLPGYGFAKVPRSVQAGWSRMVGTYLSDRESLLSLVIIADARRGFGPDDLSLLETCAHHGLQPILVATKCDKLKPNALYNRQAAIARDLATPKNDIVWFSARTRKGSDLLWRRIQGLLPAPAPAR